MRAPVTFLLQALRPVLPARWRLPRAFAPSPYLAQNPDLAAYPGDPALHFLRHGRVEGRAPCPLRAPALEAALWAGDPAARAALARLHAAPGAEGLWAALALARVAAVAGDWDKGVALLSPTAPFIAHLGLPDPLLLLAELALRQGDAPGARRALARARHCFGPLPGTALLRAALALHQKDIAGWRAAMAGFYTPHGLSVPDMQTAPDAMTAPFDRLAQADAPGPGPSDPPQVSVILPARNAAATIDTALAGLVAQSWTDFELLVVENGSTDATEARVRAWAAHDPRIRLVRSDPAKGAYGARNLGAARARGTFVTVHDADDWSHPARVERQIQALRAHPDTVACLAHWVRMTPDLIPALWRPDLRPIHPNLSSVMVRREVLAQVGPWDCVRAGADSEFIARLRHVFGSGRVLALLPDVPLTLGRVQPGSLTRGAQTGLLGDGAAARRAYLDAAAAWHRASGQPRMPDHGGQAGQRPFAVPPALALRDAQA